MRVLTLDIETGPNLVYCWGLWDQNIGLNQIVDSGEVLCFAGKWMDKKKVHYYSVHHNGKDAMVQAAWDMLNEADVVVHYNGDRFDLPWLNKEFLEAGMPPPAPYVSVDLMKVVKRKFRFPSNKLDYVVQRLNLGAKIKHTGFDLWRKCLNGSNQAWNEMRSYNIHDVKITEKLYVSLRAWTPSHPNPGLYDGVDASCPSCGSTDLVRQGRAYTSVSVYQRYRCSSCGRWSRGSKRLEGSSVRGI